MFLLYSSQSHNERTGLSHILSVAIDFCACEKLVYLVVKDITACGKCSASKTSHL